MDQQTIVKKKRKKKRKLNRLGKTVVGTGAALIVIAMLSIPTAIEKNTLSDLGYSKDGISAIKSQKISSYIRKGKYYSELLESAIIKKEFNKEYIDYYVNLKEFNNDYIKVVEKLLDKGYTNEDLLRLLQENSLEELYPLLVYDKIGDLEGYIKSGIDKSDYSLLNPYENMKDDVEWSVDMLVNKKHSMPATVEVSNLRVVDNNCAFRTTYLVDEAATAFENMCKAAKEDNIHFAASYGYRSYEEQQELYNLYVDAGGVEYADAEVARAGSSEHQTGLAVDVASMMNTTGQLFVNTEEYAWLYNNAHKYGFIERYTVEAEEITGYEAESYHWRYVGVELAEKVHSSGLTYEEYTELYMEIEG